MTSIKRSPIPLMSLAGIFTLLIGASSCSEKPQADPCCRISDIPPGSNTPSGQGAVRVDGSTTATYYILNDKGQQVAYESLSKSLDLAPGSYQIKLNNSTHPLEVQPGKLTHCGTGTLMVRGSTPETYYVMDTLGNQLSYAQLGSAISLFATSITVKINNSVMRANVNLNEVTEIETGTLLVHGTTGETYYVLDATTGEQLSYNLLEKPLAILPGTYTTTLNKTSGKADITAGQTTELNSGALVVHGTTDETYYILDAAGTQLAYNTLEKALAFLPGSYIAKLNNTRLNTEVTGTQLTELQTGTLLVKGLTDETYYVNDSSGNQLSYQTINKPLAFFPGRLTVTLNKTETKSLIAMKSMTELASGAVLVTGSGGDTYYMLDPAGNQLAYQTINKALSFFPGEYTVKLGQSTRKAQVTSGRIYSLPSFK
jgi:hypothetical protein